MLNRIFIIGRLTKDPELSWTQAGTAVTSITVAVERNYKEKDGSKTTDFFDVVAWRSTAEFIAKYFAKGRVIVVGGSLQFRDWTDRDGRKCRSAEVIAEEVYFGDSRPQTGDQKVATYDGAAGFEEADEDGSLPF